jgi:tetratricopeptide (TPR) repeat protein
MQPIDSILLPEVELSNSLIAKGSFLEALEPLKELILSGNHRGYLYLGIGDIHRQLGREDISHNDKAKKFYENAINLAEIDGDNQVIIAAKSGLAWIAIREVQEAYNNLPDEDKWAELKASLPFCLEPVLLAYQLGGLDNCTCKDPSGASRKNGRMTSAGCVAGGCRPVSM